ncbi:bis(5'-nucleosyl)-tetraphosphatase PrpE [Lentibacillus saliphilus]|uniref:bis(5'-nucleosyl)-tetraphosphatase PrpE n=1 Tax=Lentibacillus saliphilus TaxID=2737028 RepID=UPI001C2F3A8E|nr:bis(5'-nucleosyl)-tetraphosphatase PrpE [Lentibacillus saliphilus]
MKVDVIGDIHGCFSELEQLFKSLGYHFANDVYRHPEGRMPVFVGDLTDRGPQSIKVIEIVSHMVLEAKAAHYVPGNHCNKLYRFFKGNAVQQKHGLETTVAEYNALSEAEQTRIKRAFMTLYEQAPLYLVLPDVNAVIAHAGIKEAYIGRTDQKAKSFVLYGDTTGEKHPDGRPVRRDWAQHYNGERWIIYGHTPVLEPRFVNKTINIDTGCVFGNALTAFRLPEETTISIPSEQPFQQHAFSFTN